MAAASGVPMLSMRVSVFWSVMSCWLLGTIDVERAASSSFLEGGKRLSHVGGSGNLTMSEARMAVAVVVDDFRRAVAVGDDLRGGAMRKEPEKRKRRKVVDDCWAFLPGLAGGGRVRPVLGLRPGCWGFLCLRALPVRKYQGGIGDDDADDDDGGVGEEGQSVGGQEVEKKENKKRRAGGVIWDMVVAVVW